MLTIEIDKSVLEEIKNTIERRDKMYENQIATTKKLTDGIEKLYEQEVKKLRNQLQQKENIIKEVREDLHQVVKWCTENKHNEDTIERYLVVDYGTITGKINEIRTKLDKGEK